jgi:hypothetical protein
MKAVLGGVKGKMAGCGKEEGAILLSRESRRELGLGKIRAGRLTPPVCLEA